MYFHQFLYIQAAVIIVLVLALLIFAIFSYLALQKIIFVYYTRFYLPVCSVTKYITKHYLFLKYVEGFALFISTERY